MRALTISIFSILFFCSCNEFEGPKGDTGQQGPAGTSCSNQSVSNQVNPTFDPDTGTVTAAHTRTVYSTAGAIGPRITIYTGTSADYFDALTSGDHNYLDSYVANPIDTDMCDLWYWVNSGGPDWQLHADNSVAYRATHMPSAVADEDGNAHLGMDKCMHDCQADSQCVGGFYNAVEGTKNMLLCVLLMDAGLDIAPASEFQAIDTQIPGILVANLQLVGAVDGGFFSICD